MAKTIDTIEQLKLSKLIEALLLLLAALPLVPGETAMARTLSTAEFCQLPIEPNPAVNNVITSKMISEEGLTVPSLWWTKEQFDPFGGKLVNNWIAYRNEHRIDLIVNPQLWTLLDYLGRYRFVNKFGTAARDYRYNLRVFDDRQQCLATYICNFSTSPHQCEVEFNPSFENGLKKRSISF